MARLFLWALALVCLGVPGLVEAANWTVGPASDNDCADNDCQLQNVLPIAATNQEADTITIAEGVYDATVVPHYAYDGQFNFPLTIQGAGIGKTVLHGGDANQVLSVKTLGVNGGDGPDNDADINISGITFRNGNSSTPGGGLYVETMGADIAVHHCSFEFNSSSSGEDISGGGLFAATNSGTPGVGNVTVTDSYFFQNVSPMDSGGGAVLVATFGDVVLEDNVFIDNAAGDMAGGTGSVGGGAFAVAVFDGLLVNRNVFLENQGDAGGGGLYAGVVFGQGVISNNIVAGNMGLGADDSAGIFGGGAGMRTFQIESSLNIIHNTVTDNHDAGSGGGLTAQLFFNAASLGGYNNILWGNTAVGGGSTGGSFCPAGGCDDIAIDDNSPLGDNDNLGSAVILANNNYTDVYFRCPSGNCDTPDHTLSNNKNVDPLFVNAAQNDFHLDALSQMIDMGDGAAPDIPPQDYDLRSRPVNTLPDIGAYEWSEVALAPETRCQNGLDDDSDGAVDCNDTDCVGSDACPADGGTSPEDCSNGIDDDGDGLVDCFDLSCLPTCFGGAINLENCSNGIDDDENGQTDCEDVKCSLVPACLGAGGLPFPPSGECQSLIDCLNPECQEAEICQLPDIEIPDLCGIGCVPCGAGSPGASVPFLMAPMLLAAVRRWKKSSRGKKPRRR